MRDKNVAQTAPNCIFDQNGQSLVCPLFMRIQRRLPLKIIGDPNGIRTRVGGVFRIARKPSQNEWNKQLSGAVGD